MTTEAAEHWEHASFADFKPGDRIHFWTNNNGYGGVGEVWRTGTVAKVTAKTITVDCDRNRLGARAVIRLAEWARRCPMKASQPGPTAPPAHHHRTETTVTRYTVTRFDGSHVTEGEQLTVDNNLPVTYLGVAAGPWGDDASGEWEPGQVTVRYAWGAVESVADSRAGVFVNEA